MGRSIYLSNHYPLGDGPRFVDIFLNHRSDKLTGSVWEQMVQCVKKVLGHTEKELASKEHVLGSLLVETENVLSSRPLTLTVD